LRAVGQKISRTVDCVHVVVADPVAAG
jgi:hypothetical protein